MTIARLLSLSTLILSFFFPQCLRPRSDYLFFFDISNKPYILNMVFKKKKRNRKQEQDGKQRKRSY